MVLVSGSKQLIPGFKNNKHHKTNRLLKVVEKRLSDNSAPSRKVHFNKARVTKTLNPNDTTNSQSTFSVKSMIKTLASRRFQTLEPKGEKPDEE